MSVAFYDLIQFNETFMDHEGKKVLILEPVITLKTTCFSSEKLSITVEIGVGELTLSG